MGLVACESSLLVVRWKWKSRERKCLGGGVFSKAWLGNGEERGWLEWELRDCFVFKDRRYVNLYQC